MTNETLAYEATTSLGIDIVLKTLHKLKRNHLHLTKDALNHSFRSRIPLY